MSEAPWSPAQYGKFRDARARPFYDLIDRLSPIPDGFVVDLGCGTGELTKVLHECVCAGRTLGIDSSAEMLAQSAAHRAPGVSFKEGDLRDLDLQGSPDLVFSNAALHWVDEHPALLARIWARLAEGGRLAVQVPFNDGHASHRLARELAGTEPWHTELGGFERVSPVLLPREYLSLLHGLGARDSRAWLEVYAHELEGPDGVVEWVKGSLLTAYQARLPPERYAAFVEAYRKRLGAALGEGPLLYTYDRVFFLARK